MACAARADGMYKVCKFVPAGWRALHQRCIVSVGRCITICLVFASLHLLPNREWWQPCISLVLCSNLSTPPPPSKASLAADVLLFNNTAPNSHVAGGRRPLAPSPLHTVASAAHRIDALQAHAASSKVREMAMRNVTLQCTPKGIGPGGISGLNELLFLTCLNTKEYCNEPAEWWCSLATAHYICARKEPAKPCVQRWNDSFVSA